MIRSALLGLGDPSFRDQIVFYCHMYGFIVEAPDTFSELEQLARTREFGLYMMDLDFQAQTSLDISPAKTIYDLIKEQVKSNDAIFIGFSDDLEAISLALGKGIPAKHKTIHYRT
ncbi:hypothetical protein HYX12_01490 [Candidatus Woesearchaeota archaeon]|nr:hypothetical protein [Candidatus Woesearchaeota archaeon]